MFKSIRSKAVSVSVLTFGLLTLGLSSCSNGNNTEEVAAAPAIAVRLKTLESSLLIDSSEYVGTLQASDRVSLASRTDGRILEIFVTQGDRVQKGDPLVRLEPTREQENVNAAVASVNLERSRLGSTEAELSTAEANRAAAAAEVERAKADVQDAESEVELAKINIARTSSLVEGGALAKQELDNDNRDLKSSLAQLNSRQEALNAAIKSLQAAEKRIEQARANIDSQSAAIRRAEAELASVNQNLAFNTINAPIDGIVGSFDDKKVGDYLDIGEQLTTITNNQNLELNLNIPIENRDRLKTGLVVETVNGGARGQITYIAPLVQQNTQSILTKVNFSNAESLRDQEYMRVRVIWNESPGLLVPTIAVSSLAGQNFVFVATENDSQDNNSQTSLIVQQKPVKLGKIQNQDYQVISGLEPGDRIAVSNVLILRDGVSIRESEE